METSTVPNKRDMVMLVVEKAFLFEEIRFKGVFPCLISSRGGGLLSFFGKA